MFMEYNPNAYDKYPFKQITERKDAIYQGYTKIQSIFLEHMQSIKKSIIVIECYPGIEQAELLNALSSLPFDKIIHSDTYAYEPEKIDSLLASDLTEDRVFGFMTFHHLKDYFYLEKIKHLQSELQQIDIGNILIYGVGASLISQGTLCILADITRWEIQLRFRKGMSNWRTAQKNIFYSFKYKRGFFAEWRWADKQKKSLLPTLDYYLDMNIKNHPIMVYGEVYRMALAKIAKEPFRLVPYFDPGIWGGDWMKTHFSLEENNSNYAWSFDGVPEENSLNLKFGDVILQTPALNLIYYAPTAVLGEKVHARFGTEFPIRFDLLDTMHGQNLSLQVHPLTEYIQEHFNMHYTQDESYYILDAKPNSYVYLGLKTNVDRKQMKLDLETAHKNTRSFPVDTYVNKFPVQKHEHILIPAGTLHASGKDTMVLEISATPYIFTFKLWDWERKGLDGQFRPIHLNHGFANIQWERDTDWVEKNLLHQEKMIYQSKNSKIERTGLHQREFIDTYRITTNHKICIKRNDSVHVLNLVEGEIAIIRSPFDLFSPFEVHYAETFIVPNAAQEYEIESKENRTIQLMLAVVRD